MTQKKVYDTCLKNFGMVVLQVRDTKMNAESSRSHQILRIYIESRPAVAQGANYKLFSTEAILHLEILAELH